jgi:hypothetical protein
MSGEAGNAFAGHDGKSGAGGSGGDVGKERLKLGGREGEESRGRGWKGGWRESSLSFRGFESTMELTEIMEGETSDGRASKRSAIKADMSEVIDVVIQRT